MQEYAPGNNEKTGQPAAQEISGTTPYKRTAASVTGNPSEPGDSSMSRNVVNSNPHIKHLELIQKMADTSSQVKQAATLQARISQSFARQISSPAPPKSGNIPEAVKSHQARIPPIQRQIIEVVNSNSLQKVIQRVAVDNNKFNVVSEDHSKYGIAERDTEKYIVEEMMGAASYHIEDTFAGGAYPTAGTDLVDFTSKADPVYYAVQQGLEFIKVEAKKIIASGEIRGPIKSMAERVSRDAGQLSKANPHIGPLVAKILEKIDEICRLAKDESEGLNDILRKEANTLGQLVNGTEIILQNEFKGERGEFEGMAGIAPHWDTLKKRSKTMFDHAEAWAQSGNKGILKVGRHHLEDMRSFSATAVLLCNERELEDALKRHIRSRTTSTANNDDEDESATGTNTASGAAKDYDAEDDFY